MADLKTRFEDAAQRVQKLARRPDDHTLLKLYALYKQATVGDVTGSRPGLADFKDRLKYDAWARLKGMSKDKAMQDYIALVESLEKKFK